MELSEVADALENARATVERMLWHKSLEDDADDIAAEVALADTAATLRLEGYDLDTDSLRAWDGEDAVVRGAIRVTEALPGLVDVWKSSPRYVLARLHMFATSDFEVSQGSPQPGRPDLDAAGSARMDALCALVSNPTSDLPPALRAAVIHGELLSLHPFPLSNDIVARAAAKLTLAAQGMDPRFLIALNAGHLEREPEYVGSAKSFNTGTPDGVRSWLKHFGMALETGAGQTLKICNETE